MIQANSNAEFLQALVDLFHLIQKQHIYESVSLWFPMGIAIPPNTVNYRQILYGNQPLHNGHNFSREVIHPGSFVRGLGGRMSRFALNDDVSARITFA